MRDLTPGGAGTDTGAPIITLDDVRRALALPDFDPVAAQARMAPIPRPFQRTELPGQPNLAGVLILLYPLPIHGSHEGREGEALSFVLMRRTEYPGVHSGQISLPGGKREGDESFEETALREAREEVGATGPVTILGALTPLYVPPSDFEIHPIVGYVPERPVWTPDPVEVAAIIEVPLTHLLDASLKITEEWTRSGRQITVPFYRFDGHQVWGATAIILSEFEGRLQSILS